MEVTDPVIATIRANADLAEKIAKSLGISRSAIRQWQRVPANRVHRLSTIMSLHPHFIRPDIFPKPRKPKQPAQSRAVR